MITNGRTKDQNSADNDKRYGNWTLHVNAVKLTFLLGKRNLESQYRA